MWSASYWVFFFCWQQSQLDQFASSASDYAGNVKQKMSEEKFNKLEWDVQNWKQFIVFFFFLYSQHCLWRNLSLRRLSTSMIKLLVRAVWNGWFWLNAQQTMALCLLLFASKVSGGQWVCSGGIGKVPDKKRKHFFFQSVLMFNFITAFIFSLSVWWLVLTIYDM